MAKTDNLTDFLTNTASAIRTAEGSIDLIDPQDFESKIIALKLSTQTSKFPSNKFGATPETMLEQSSAYVNGERVDGEIPVVEDMFFTLDKDNTYINLTGNYYSACSVSIFPEEKIVTPSADTKTIVPEDGKVLSAVKVLGDDNLVPENIKKGETIFGISGSYEGEGGGSIDTCTVVIDVNSLRPVIPNNVYICYTACDFQLKSLFTIHEDADVLADYRGADPFIAYDYIENPDGVIVPVLYKTNIESYPDEVDYGDVFYYVGTYDYGGEIYDRWQKVDSGNDTYDWNSSVKCYELTERIIKDGVFNIPNGTIVSKTINTTASKLPEIYLHNVICGSSMCLKTNCAVTDSRHLLWTDEYTHFVSCHNSRETMRLVFYFND